MVRAVFAVLALAEVAACTPVPPAPDSPDQCGAAGYSGLIGQPAPAVKAMTFPEGTRIIGPEDAVTDDFRPGRLNIEYGRAGLVEKISCY